MGTTNRPYKNENQPTAQNISNVRHHCTEENWYFVQGYRRSTEEHEHCKRASSPLFDGDLSAHINKSQFRGEIEQRLKVTNEAMQVTHVIVSLDFISKMRQMPLAKCATVGEACANSLEFVRLVLESYIEMSA